MTNPAFAAAYACLFTAVFLSGCGSPEATPPAAYNSDVGAELTALQDAYAAGTISQEEFDAKRRAILGGSAG